MPDLVHYDVTDGVAVLTIDNPPVNALSAAVWEAIDKAVARARTDRSAEAIVLTGAGTTFIAGADIKVFDLLKTREDSLARTADIHALLKRIEDSTKPLVAAIHGYALGGGLEVAMACHYRVATRGALVGQPEVLLGIIPGAGGTQRLPRLAGARLALDMCTHGKPLGAPAALAAGILDRVVDGDRAAGGLLPAAIAFAKARAKALEMRRTRELPIRPEDVSDGAAACDAARAGLGSKPRRGRRARRGGRDSGGADAVVRRRLEARARALRGLCRLDRVESAPAHVLRRARGREGPRHPEGHAGEGHQARRGGRRRHDGGRHRDDVRERRHPGAAERRRPGGAASAGWRPSAGTTT